MQKIYKILKEGNKIALNIGAHTSFFIDMLYVGSAFLNPIIFKILMTKRKFYIRIINYIAVLYPLGIIKQHNV